MYKLFIVSNNVQSLVDFDDTDTLSASALYYIGGSISRLDNTLILPIGFQ